MPTPRKLTLIHIDDDYHLETHSVDAPYFENIPISGWQDILDLWTKSPKSPFADLIVSDLLLERDSGTPLACLSQVGSHKPLPTGISHLKAFAAVARAEQRPIGIAMHSRSTDYWLKLLAGNDPLGRTMSLVAAHEAGELAAILGVKQTKGSRDPHAEAKKCLEWLKANSPTEFRGAKLHAIRGWRAKAIRMGNPREGARNFILMPRQYLSLMAWVDQMKAGPEPIQDKALCFLRADGSEDCILLSSIFGEIDGIETRKWKSICFDYGSVNFPDREADAIATLDESGRPKIGAFIRAMGSMARIYWDAVEAVEQMPACPDPGPSAQGLKLTEVTSAYANPAEVKGLAMLLQIVRMEHDAYTLWQDVMGEKCYHDRSNRFTGRSKPTGHSVRDSLQLLATAFRGRGKRYFTVGALFDEFAAWPAHQDREFIAVRDKSVNSALAWNLERLVDAKSLSKNGGENEYCAEREYSILGSSYELIEFHKIPYPDTLPEGADQLGLVYRRSKVMDALKKTLGYTDDVQINRDMGTLVGERNDAPRGTALRTALLGRETVAPAWVLRLLQEYAEDRLMWSPYHGWPAWLQGPAPAPAPE